MRRFLASCSVVVIAIALLGACGGSESKNPASPGTNPGDTSPGGSGSSDIAKLYADAAKQKFKITFSSGSGDSTTYAQDGNGKSVYTSGDTQTFVTATETVTCSTSSGKATCTQNPGGSTISPFLGIYNAGKTYVSALAGYGDKSSKTIAGRDAQCVTISGKSVASKAGPAAAAIAAAIKGSVGYCIDKSTGVLLEATATDASGTNTSIFQVTKYEEPSASDFTPPATPSSVSLPSGYTVPSYTIPGGG
jgi:hypothetical protein